MRKLATAAAVSLALASGGAFGLGLGDIEMRSALNQPMNAEIRLTSVKAGELEGMIVQLASPEAFARAGIERSSVLTDLRFSVDTSSGAPVIRISSQQPVIEPFLNFLLEVDWPQGRMVREYTVLLDPPLFMTPTATERDSTADQPALVERGTEALVVPTPIERNDGAEVDLSDLAEDATVPASKEGDVSLEALPDSALLAGNEAVTLGSGEVVSLTDLGARNNTSADTQSNQQVKQPVVSEEIIVELVGSDEEVSDTTVIGAKASASSDRSTPVSQDDLTPEELSPEAERQAIEVAVGRGDTLYEIAQDNAKTGVTVQQMMMALLAANESAFINNNINLVKAGAILRVPEVDEATRLTQQQALAAIGTQNQLWQEYRNQLQKPASTQIASGDETPAPAPTTTDTPEKPEGEAVSDTTAIETAAVETSLTSEESVDGLSEEARAILDRARNEILERDELRLVADSAPSSTTASATADETENSEASRLGEVNRKLQLAREELSSTRLQADELSEQASELQGTSENLDSLVTLRQNEIAQLENQLTEARKLAEENAAKAEAEATAKAEAEAAAEAEATAKAEAEAAAKAEEEATANAEAAARVEEEAAAKAAADAAAKAEEEATAKAEADAAAKAEEEATAKAEADAASKAAESTADNTTVAAAAGNNAVTAVGDAAQEAADKAETVADSGVKSLTEAGEELAEVENIGGEAVGDTAAEIPPPRVQSTWYQDLMNDPKRLAIAGVGAVGLLGVLGTLLFRRKRREDDDLLEIRDEAEFDKDKESDALQAQMRSESGSASNTVAAAGAGVIGSGVNDMAESDPQEKLNDSLAELENSNKPLESDSLLDTALPDKEDDTLSEVEVYLAYGLHGQAEELLTKATQRDPDNQEYAHKLIQTYHAQGNGEGFHAAASSFHERFGGDSNPQWLSIAAMGAELRPTDPMYASGHDAVSRVGAGHSDGNALGDEDFLPAQDNDSGSFTRDFRASEEAVDFDSDDESSMMDHSLDPAFAFDEGDLEATGDFSGAAADLAAENEGSIDFPGFENSAGESDSADDLPSATPGDLPGDLTNELSADLTEGDELLGDALTIDELDRVASVDDLTLDLDQLSGELDLDSSELMNADLSDLDLPDLTIDNDMFGDNVNMGDNADEMDTMLDLAKAYIDMGDKDSASSALGEIVKSGNPEQVNEAETLLRKIS